MSLSSINPRITGKDVRVYFQACNIEDSSLVFNFTVPADVVTGSLYFRINGVKSNALDLSATIDAAALNAVFTGVKIPLVGVSGLYTILTGDLVGVTATPQAGYFQVTFQAGLADKALIVRLDIDGIPGDDPSEYNFAVTTPGSELIRWDADMYALDFAVSTEDVDATAISEFHDQSIAVRQAMAGNISMYNSKQPYRWLFGLDNLEGRLYIYPYGVGTGKEVVVNDVRINEASDTIPDHDKMETELSWKRLGESINRVGDLQ